MTIIKDLNSKFHIENCILGYGHFNTIHPGHIRYLKHAKSLGEKLIIALIGDSNNKGEKTFKFSQNDRAEALDLLNISDYIICLKYNELDSVLKKLKPKILVLGNEFQKTKDKNILNAINFQKKFNKSILFHAGEVNYASTDLLLGSENELIEKRKNQFFEALRRQNITKIDLLSSLNCWKSSHLIVLGDTIIDQYAACEAVGLSAEAPVLVVRELAKKNYIGGAAIVASHINALGATSELISVTGNDDVSNIASRLCKEIGVNNNFIIDSSRPTTFKKRYVVENQKLFRVSKLEDHTLNKEIEDKLIDKLEKIAPKANGIIISDFVYGVITERVLKKVHSLSKKHNLLLFGDLQCSSQVGSILKFKNFSLLCPNEREARISLQDKESGLELLSNTLISKTRSKRFIMKLGAEGFIAYDRNNKDQLTSQSFPALSVNPVDVAGAGDSLLAAMASGLTSNQSMMKTAAISCFITSLAVETMGNVPIKKEKVLEAIEYFFN